MGWRALDGMTLRSRIGLVDLDAPPQLLEGDRVPARLRGLRGLGPGPGAGGDRGGAWCVLLSRARRRLRRRAGAALADGAAPGRAPWPWWRRIRMTRRSTEVRVDSSTVSTEVVPQQGTTEETSVRPDPSTGDGDHERFAHYVLKDKIVDSAVLGIPVVALCGKKWVPSRDPSGSGVPRLQADLRVAARRRLTGGDLGSYSRLTRAGRGVLRRAVVPGEFHPAARISSRASAMVTGSTTRR